MQKWRHYVDNTKYIKLYQTNQIGIRLELYFKASIAFWSCKFFFDTGAWFGIKDMLSNKKNGQIKFTTKYHLTYRYRHRRVHWLTHNQSRYYNFWILLQCSSKTWPTHQEVHPHYCTNFEKLYTQPQWNNSFPMEISDNPQDMDIQYLGLF